MVCRCGPVYPRPGPAVCDHFPHFGRPPLAGRPFFVRGPRAKGRPRIINRAGRILRKQRYRCEGSRDRKIMDAVAELCGLPMTFPLSAPQPAAAMIGRTRRRARRRPGRSSRASRSQSVFPSLVSRELPTRATADSLAGRGYNPNGNSLWIVWEHPPELRIFPRLAYRSRMPITLFFGIVGSERTDTPV